MIVLSWVLFWWLVVDVLFVLVMWRRGVVMDRMRALTDDRCTTCVPFDSVLHANDNVLRPRNDVWRARNSVGPS